MTTPIPSLTLNDGYTIPQLGFGGDFIPPDQTEAAVTIALEAGFRHIDTAAGYRNEAETGAAIAASSLRRDELFVTTKVWNSDQGRDRTRRAFESSLSKLGLDCIDLLLIHWPAPSRGLYEETWLTLIDLQREGLVRSIGVSNFEPEHLARLAEVSDVVPAVNQIELQPFLQQERLRAYHHEHGIVTESWIHLAEAEVEVLFPVIVEIAERHNVNAARVALAWNLQLGTVALSRSVTPERIRGNREAVSAAAQRRGDGRDRRAGPRRTGRPGSDSVPVKRRSTSMQKLERNHRSMGITRMLFSGVLCVSVAVGCAAATTFAQSSDRSPVTDAEKIADALRAGPVFVTKDATLLDWPLAPGGEYRVLRKGSSQSQWTCLPGRSGSPHDEPACFDQGFLQFIKDGIAGRTPNLQGVGVSYMYGGFWVPNKSHAMGSGNEFHVGPHIMIVGLDQKMLQTLNHDGSNGQPYVNHFARRSELYLVIPIREWNDTQAQDTVGGKATAPAQLQ